MNKTIRTISRVSGAFVQAHYLARTQSHKKGYLIDRLIFRKEEVRNILIVEATLSIDVLDIRIDK